MPRPPNFTHEDDASDLTPLGKLLDYWLWQHRMSAGQLAYKVGISPNTVYYWMRRGTKPQIETIYRLGEVTGIPMEQLFEAIGIVIPTDSPAPLRKRPVPPPVNPWEYALRRAEQDTTIDEAMRASLIQWIRNQALGYDPQAERQRQEQEYGAPIEPAPTPDEVGEVEGAPSHRETPRPAGQERRAPRKRQSTPPRRAR